MAANTFRGKAPAKGEGGDYAVCPPGNHPAVLVAMIDLGTQEEAYQGQSRKVRQVFLVWELTAEKAPGSAFNFVLGKAYTLSFHEKAGLRQMAEKWRGKPYPEEAEIDYGAMVGKTCLLSVVNKQSANNRTYAQVAGVSAVPKGLAVPNPMHKPFTWEIGTNTPAELPDWLPYCIGEKVPDVIKRAPESSGQQPAANGQPTVGDAPQSDADEADIPF